MILAACSDGQHELCSASACSCECHRSRYIFRGGERVYHAVPDVPGLYESALYPLTDPPLYVPYVLTVTGTWHVLTPGRGLGGRYGLSLIESLLPMRRLQPSEEDRYCNGNTEVANALGRL